MLDDEAPIPVRGASKVNREWTANESWRHATAA